MPRPAHADSDGSRERKRREKKDHKKGKKEKKEKHKKARARCCFVAYWAASCMRQEASCQRPPPLPVGAARGALSTVAPCTPVLQQKKKHSKDKDTEKERLLKEAKRFLKQKLKDGTAPGQDPTDAGVLCCGLLALVPGRPWRCPLLFVLEFEMWPS